MFPPSALPMLVLGAFALLAVGAGSAAAQGRPPNPVGQIEANSEAIEALEAETTLSDLSCDEGAVPQYDGSQWVCAGLSTAAPVLYSRSRTNPLVTDPVQPVATLIQIFCEPGDVVLSGGFDVPFGGQYLPVASLPSPAGQGWLVSVQAPPTTPGLTATVYVRCLDLTP